MSIKYNLTVSNNLGFNIRITSNNATDIKKTGGGGGQANKDLVNANDQNVNFKLTYPDGLQSDYIYLNAEGGQFQLSNVAQVAGGGTPSSNSPTPFNLDKIEIHLYMDQANAGPTTLTVS